jgi:hypothetical protein
MTCTKLQQAGILLLMLYMELVMPEHEYIVKTTTLAFKMLNFSRRLALKDT